MNQNITIMNYIEKPIIAPEMCIYDQQGKRLYLSREERGEFLEAANQESPEARLFCHVLHDTGCRPSEALALTANGIQLTECTSHIKKVLWSTFTIYGW